MLPNNAPDAHKTRRRKIFKRILLVCVLLAAAGLALLAGLNLYVVSSAKPYILTESEASELEDVDCIIVLGALVYSDGTMSDVLRHRVEMGTALFEAGVSDRILMSGDHSRPGYDEVGTMKDYAVAAGVDPDCVFKDHAGLDTYSTMYRAKEIFQAEKVVVVTQAFHVSRAVYLARLAGAGGLRRRLRPRRIHAQGAQRAARNARAGEGRLVGRYAARAEIPRRRHPHLGAGQRDRRRIRPRRERWKGSITV